MAFAITNKAVTLPTNFVPVEASTSQMQFVSTATSTSAGAFTHWELADYTTTGPIPLQGQVVTGSIGDFGAAYRTFRALINFKSLTYGTATSTGVIGGPLVTLEVATSTAGWGPGAGSSGQGVNYIVLDSKVLFGTSGTSTGATQTMFLFGMTPSVNGAQFARVNFYNQSGVLGGNSSSTAVDVILEAC